MKPITKLLILLAPACGFDSSTPVRNDGGLGVSDAEDVTSDADVSPVYGFSDEYEEWRVPDTGTLGGAYTTRLRNNWALLDLDGDAVPEFVHTLDPDANQAWSSAPGEHYWRVYSSGAGGFVTPSEELPLPSGPAGGFYGIELTRISETLDMDGDGYLDLVHLTDPATDQLWDDDGRLSWRIFRGSSSGFGAEEFWSLPDIGPDTLFQTTRVSGTGIWTTIDITGDGIADLVHSAEPPLNDVFEPDDPNWHVYVGGDFGYATTSTRWTLPVNGHARGFFDTDLADRWRTLDIDRDGSLELVQFGEITSPFVGPFYDGTAPFWRVFTRSGNGFDLAADKWNLPVGVAPFDAISRSQDSLQWEVLDLDGDGALDLVHTANPSSATAAVWGAPNSDQWKVYLGNETGFDLISISWPVPDSGTESGFYAVSEEDNEKRWLTVDLDGDGQVELVQTADPSTGAVWSDGDGAYWRVYRRRQ